MKLGDPNGAIRSKQDGKNISGNYTVREWIVLRMSWMNSRGLHLSVISQAWRTKFIADVVRSTRYCSRPKLRRNPDGTTMMPRDTKF